MSRSRRTPDEMLAAPIWPCSRASGGGKRDGVARAPTGSTMRCASGCAAAHRRSGSASASSLRSSARRRTAASKGSAILPGPAVRLRDGRVPRIGWARSSPVGEAYYFAHSFAAETPAATASSEGVVAEARLGSFLGVQFHPEKSGAGRSALPGAMPLPRLIPCLDVAGRSRCQGRALRGAARRGRPGRARRRLLRRRCRRARLPRRQGDASRSGRRWSSSSRRVAERLAIPFTVGGGVRSVADAAALLDAGADKVSVNSAALARPALLGELAERLGSQAVVIAIDAAGGEVLFACRARVQPVAWPSIGRASAQERGAGEILLTSIDADGTREGYDLELTRAVAGAVSIPVIASGGAGQARTRRGGARGRPGRAARVDPPREPATGSAPCVTSSASDGCAAP